MHGVVQFLQLFVDVRSRRGISDVRIDLALKSDANPHRLEVSVIDIGGNNRAPPCDFAAHELRIQFFSLRDVLHLFRNHALPRQMHLRHIAIPIHLG